MIAIGSGRARGDLCFRRLYSTEKYLRLRDLVDDGGAEKIQDELNRKRMSNKSRIGVVKPKNVKKRDSVGATALNKEINKYMQIPIKERVDKGELSRIEKFFRDKHTKIRLDWSVFKKEQLKDGDLPEILLLGRCNVGKSSLVNAILHTDLARVKQHAGYTPCLNFYNVGNRFRLVDSPGYGVKGKKWQGELVLGYCKHRRVLQKVIVIVDASVGITVHDESIMEMLQQNGITFEVVLHKIDKIPGVSRLQTVVEDNFAVANGGYLAGLPLLPQCYAVSSHENDGVAELVSTFAQF